MALRIVVVCKVIDNYGDAGFALRLARRLAHLGHTVCIVHDNPLVFAWLHDPVECPNLALLDATANQSIRHAAINDGVDLILEPFASSSEQTTHRFDQTLKRQWPNIPWLSIEYLSAEDWVESFHLQPSIHPTSSHRSTYFFPGFGPNTGGLIHKDAPTANTTPANVALVKNKLRLFVFCYPNAPSLALEQACAADAEVFPPQQLVPQWRFDELLHQHDVLFVRGEDSFVRAQLAGKPLVWQIYPCEDQSHVKKLTVFFERYSQGLDCEPRDALWAMWTFWNGLQSGTAGDAQLAWQRFYQHLGSYQAHAMAWQHQLRQGKDLVDEVLRWHASICNAQKI